MAQAYHLDGDRFCHIFLLWDKAQQDTTVKKFINRFIAELVLYLTKKTIDFHQWSFFILCKTDRVISDMKVIGEN